MNAGDDRMRDNVEQFMHLLKEIKNRFEYEDTNRILVFGDPSSGKTTYGAMICEYLSGRFRCHYSLTPHSVIVDTTPRTALLGGNPDNYLNERIQMIQKMGKVAPNPGHNFKQYNIDNMILNIENYLEIVSSSRYNPNFSSMIKSIINRSLVDNTMNIEFGLTFFDTSGTILKNILPYLAILEINKRHDPKKYKNMKENLINSIVNNNHHGLKNDIDNIVENRFLVRNSQPLSSDMKDNLCKLLKEIIEVIEVKNEKGETERELKYKFQAAILFVPMECDRDYYAQINSFIYLHQSLSGEEFPFIIVANMLDNLFNVTNSDDRRYIYKTHLNELARLFTHGGSDFPVPYVPVVANERDGPPTIGLISLNRGNLKQIKNKEYCGLDVDLPLIICLSYMIDRTIREILEHSKDYEEYPEYNHFTSSLQDVILQKLGKTTIGDLKKYYRR